MKPLFCARAIGLPPPNDFGAGFPYENPLDIEKFLSYPLIWTLWLPLAVETVLFGTCASSMSPPCSWVAKRRTGFTSALFAFTIYLLIRWGHTCPLWHALIYRQAKSLPMALTFHACRTSANDCYVRIGIRALGPVPCLLRPVRFIPNSSSGRSAVSGERRQYTHHISCAECASVIVFS